ncbi:MAG: alanine racemase [Elusimicrobia bacterium]|nr:alanine racemase [Elusimicrobiota bacterium]
MTRTSPPASPAGRQPPTPSPHFFRPTWIEVDLEYISKNLHALKKKIRPRVKILFVVKANGYGHGALPLAHFVQKQRLADWFGVSSLEEGIALRQIGIRLPILVLGSLYPFANFKEALHFQLTPTVASLTAAKELESVARKMKRRAFCHVKLETGMGRIGVRWPAAKEVVERALTSKNLQLQGLYTHLACAESNPSFTQDQLHQFSEVLGHLSQIKIQVPLKHVANSCGLLRYPQSHWDMVRPGLAVYGLTQGFLPCLALKSRIVFLKQVPAGYSVGYGSTYLTRNPSRLATLPVGYADGYSRLLSNRGCVLVGGKRCPIVGSVTMDMTMIDVTEVPEARVGDVVVLVGTQGKEKITVEEIAQKMGTLSYEFVCGLSARVPRVYI